jgi:uncharacterized membrane protein YkvA (DUF1232 family)
VPARCGDRIATADLDDGAIVEQDAVRVRARVVLWSRPRQTAAMPDWLRTTVWIVGVLALLLTLVVGYLMWRFRIPPRGLVAMGGAALYLISPIDLVPEAVLGPLGLVDDAGVVAAVVLFVYKLVTARRILADGGIELGRPGRRPPREPGRR